MNAERTTKDLKEMLGKFYDPYEKKIDPSQFRYVIYARKSSESEEKQVRSLGDQTIECREIAERFGLKVVKTIQESESAKEPDIRPKFREMIEDMKRGKYEGIICWHPDRLARNMKDAGEIIDHLDKRIIKDLKFYSFTFENNTSGKMLLGIAFVLSKQYSDQLSDNVKRGHRRATEEGKYMNKAKRGYYKDINQYLRPNSNSFILVKEAFRRRLANTSLKDIAKFLNENKYSEKTKTGGNEVFKMDEKRVSEFLRDPFYTGILIYGTNIVNLTEAYDFIPTVSVDDFLKINKLSNLKKAYKLASNIYSPGEIKADLMRGMILCGECKNPMSAGITPKKNSKGGKTKYFYYRCDFGDCPKKGKSTRAKIIMGFIYDFLEQNKFTSKEVYNHFVEKMAVFSKQKEREYQSKIKSLYVAKRQAEENEGKIKDYLINEDDKEIKESFKQNLKDRKEEIKNTIQQIARIKELQKNNKTMAVNYKEFLELFGNLAYRMRKMKKMKDLDFVIRKIFLNFTIKDGKVAYYELNSPFKEFIDKGFFLDSRNY